MFAIGTVCVYIFEILSNPINEGLCPRDDFKNAENSGIYRLAHVLRRKLLHVDSTSVLKKEKKRKKKKNTNTPGGYSWRPSVAG